MTANAAVHNRAAMVSSRYLFVSILVLLSHIVADWWRRRGADQPATGHVDNPIDRVKLRRIDGAKLKDRRG